MKKRRINKSTRNRKRELPVLSYEEQQHLAEQGVICSGLCDCRPLGGPAVTYFTIMRVEDGLLATLRETTSFRLERSVALMSEIIAEESSDNDLSDINIRQNHWMN